MSHRKLLDALWKQACAWLDAELPDAGGFQALLQLAGELGPPHDWSRLERLRLEPDLGYLELWLLEQLQSEASETKGDPLWFRLRTHAWKGQIDGGELSLERSLSDPARGPASEFSEPLTHGRECRTSPAALGVLMHEAGRARSLRHGALLEELLLGPLSVAAVAWCVQSTLERIAAPVLLGAHAGREILVGHDAGPGLALGQCGHDSWYRERVRRFGPAGGP